MFNTCKCTQMHPGVHPNRPCTHLNTSMHMVSSTLHPDWKFCCIDKILHPRESNVEPFRSRQRGIHPQNRVYRSFAQGRWTGSNFNSKDASVTAHFSAECVYNCCCQVSFQLPINFASWKVHGDIKANINVREPSGVKDLKCSAPVTG